MTDPQRPDLQRDIARLTSLIENLDGGVLVEDETRHIKLVNQAFCDMFGITNDPDELIGLNCSEGVHTIKHLFNHPDEFVKQTDDILQANTAITGDTWALQDGRVFSRDYVPVYFNDEYAGHLWHYHDVSDVFRTRTRLERLLKLEHANREITRLFLQLEDVDEALNRVLALTGKLLDVSRVYVFRFRENESILDNTHEWCAPGVTPEIENLQGLPFEELVPSFFPLMAEHDIIAPYHIDELPDDLYGILEAQDIQSILWIPMYLGDRIEGFVGYDETRQARHWLPEEITMVRIIAESYARALEREQSRRSLIRARDEAVRTARLRARFVANMSHEIRTPMTGTLGMLELLLDTDLDELQHEFATDALNSSSRLLSIINDILDFSKLEAGQVVLESDSIDVEAIASEVKMTLDPQLKEKPVRLQVAIDQDVPYRVYGDATRIRQVLMNLAANAVKFTHEGQVTIAVKMIHSVDDVASLRFTVQDTGIGIAPEKREQIFDSFVQADGGTTRKYGGSGLGLSICKQLVELMGGRIEVESTPGEGSIFSFLLHLPIARDSARDDLAAVDFSRLHVLLISERRTARYVLAQQLENQHISVSQIDSVDELTMLVKPAQFDIVFLHTADASLPPGTADKVAGRARQIVHVLDTPDTASPCEFPCLTWPVDQSSLYNVLVQGLQIHNLPVLQPAELPAPEPANGTHRILLAEDHPINVQIVRRALSVMPIQLDVVENGQQALEQLGAHPYNLVLMDIQMPVMDGIETTQHIRQSDEPFATVPILALTASVMPEERAHYLAEGINEVVSKPFTVRHLRSVVQEWLGTSEDDASPVPQTTEPV
jgi:signal transduction histidine kinase/CheY-like chemotaxis protein